MIIDHIHSVFPIILAALSTDQVVTLIIVSGSVIVSISVICYKWKVASDINQEKVLEKEIIITKIELEYQTLLYKEDQANKQMELERAHKLNLEGRRQREAKDQREHDQKMSEMSFKNLEARRTHEQRILEIEKDSEIGKIKAIQNKIEGITGLTAQWGINLSANDQEVVIKPNSITKPLSSEQTNHQLHDTSDGDPIGKKQTKPSIGAKTNKLIH